MGNRGGGRDGERWGGIMGRLQLRGFRGFRGCLGAHGEGTEELGGLFLAKMPLLKLCLCIRKSEGFLVAGPQGSTLLSASRFP